MNHTTSRRLTFPSLALLVTAAAGGLCGLAAGDVVLSTGFSNMSSTGLAGNAANSRHIINFGTGGNVRQISITGTLARIAPGSFPRESCIRFRRYTHISPQISLLTHEFVAQPFTQTTWGVGGLVSVDQAIVLPVPLSLNFAGSFGVANLSEPGRWELEFFEQYDDAPGAAVDAQWVSMQVRFDDQTPSLDTPAPVSGTVATTTRYGVRSDDDLGPGAFTGSQIANLATPSSPRIKHVRVSGYVTSLATTIGTELAGPNEAGQARLRLRRNESVLLSPNDPQAFTSSDDLFVEVPFTSGSTQYVSVDVPVPNSNDFGKLTRNVPSGGPNESYFGISYLATGYEATDHSVWDTDNIWNGLKIEFFSDAQPPAAAIDFGTLAANPAGTETVWSRTGTVNGGKVLWFTFDCPDDIMSDLSGQFLDIDTEGTTPAFDTMIALYGGTAGNSGALEASDDDDGSGTLSQLSFGDFGPRPAIGSSMPRNGRDGSIGPGRWYVAVVPYVANTGLAAFGTSDFAVTNSDATDRSVTLNLRFNVPLACGPADVGQQGGIPGGDGVLDNNDFIVFINYFFAQNPLADRGVQGGVPGTDGQFDNNDFIVFINQFFGGCGNP